MFGKIAFVVGAAIGLAVAGAVALVAAARWLFDAAVKFIARDV